MKFNEFVALEKQLKKDGSSINEFVKEVTGEYLFEKDEDELQTGGDKLKRVVSPRFAKARRKLTNNAKDFLKKSQKFVIEKFLPKQLKQLKDVANKAVGLRANNKNPKEILITLKSEIEQIRKVHEKSTLLLEESIDKMEANYTKRIQSIINNKKLSEKSQLKLNTYWVLLMVQVKQFLFKKIIELRSKSFEELISQNPELEQLLSLISKLPHTEAEIEKMNKEQDEYKKTLTGSSKDTIPEEGKNYQWTNSKGVVMKIKIIGKNPEIKGEWEVEITSPKGKLTKASISQKSINKKLGKKIM